MTYLTQRGYQSQPLDIRREPSAICGAADVVKPKARLCEPWVNAPRGEQAPKGRQRSLVIGGTLVMNFLSPLRGSAI
jgi:hypothetical protein